MSEKSLTEPEWKKFAKGHAPVKDAPLLKALGELDKARTPEARLAALDDIDKQADVLRKAGKGDKDLAGVLDEMAKAAARERKLAEADSKKAAQQEAAEGDDDDAPDVLTTKLVPLMRQVRKGDVLQVLVAVGGKDSAVLLSRKPIGPPRRKLLSTYWGVTGGLKFVPGECLWEENAYTFVVQTQAAGLAKKLKAALLLQTEQRYKVRVRGEEPGDIDDDGEPADDSAQAQTAASATTPAAPAATAATADLQNAVFDTRVAALQKQLQALPAADAAKPHTVLAFAQAKARDGSWPVALQALDSLDKLLASLAAAAARPAATPPQPAAAAPPPAPDAGPAFTARLAALMPHVKQALAAGGAHAATIRQGVADAGEAARGKRFDAAQTALDAVEQLLQAATAPAAAAAADADDGDATGASLVKLQQARLVWDGLRKTLQRQLQSLEQTMLADVRAHNQADDAEFGFDEAAVAGGVQRIYGILDRLDTRLLDTLDQALNASGTQRQQLHANAGKLVDEYRSFVEGDPLIAAIDGNGFASTSIRTAARKALADLAAQL